MVQTNRSEVERVPVLTRLATSSVVVLAVVLASSLAAIIGRRLAPSGGSLVGSPLAPFIAGSCVAVAAAALVLRRFENPPAGDDMATRLRASVHLGGPIVVPALATVVIAALLVNWWDPNRSLIGVAVAAAVGALVVLGPSYLALSFLQRPTIWWTGRGAPQWVDDVRGRVEAPAMAFGLLTLLAAPTLVAAFDPDRWGAAAVGRVWLIALVGATVAGVVGSRVGGDRALSWRLFLLRLLAALAAAGLCLVAVGDAQVTLVVVSMSCLVGLMADTEAVLRFDNSLRATRDRRAESFAAAAAQFSLMVLGLLFAFVGAAGAGGGNRELALALCLVGALEFFVVGFLCRPLVVEQGPVFHTAARGWRAAWYGSSIPPEGRTTMSAAVTGAQRARIAELIGREFQQLSRPLTAGEAAHEQSRPGAAPGDDASLDFFDDVYLVGTPLHEQSLAYRRRLQEAGLRIEGAEPKLQCVSGVIGRNPVRAELAVDHPAQRLVDASGRVCGRRRSLRRWGMVWLIPMPDGSYRLAEAVEQGSEPLPVIDLTGEVEAESLGGDPSGGSSGEPPTDLTDPGASPNGDPPHVKPPIEPPLDSRRQQTQLNPDR